MIRTALLAALLIPLGQPTALLERKVHGTWYGGDCVGELDLKADGSFERRGYSPGNNTLTGTWEIRWNALPPTLKLTCKASNSADHVGQVVETEVVRLDDANLGLRLRSVPEHPTHEFRREKW